MLGTELFTALVMWRLFAEMVGMLFVIVLLGLLVIIHLRGPY